MRAAFVELRSTGTIAVSGADASTFLHAQLTSDVAGMNILQTQYSAYCSPNGRVLATLLLWRCEDRILMQVPDELRESVRTRLSRYVLRAQVKLAAASDEYRLFGVFGSTAQDTLHASGYPGPKAVHEAARYGDSWLTRLPRDRFLLVVAAEKAPYVRDALALQAQEQAESAWARLDIEAGIPTIVRQTQERYLPQMLNLDLVGGVSYTKGCYPGQEIVARTRYLGRLKERMYRMHLPEAADPAPGTPLYSDAFGPDQASGSLLYAAPAAAGYEALAVVQKSAVSAPLHCGSADGPLVEPKSLPYTIPD